MYSKKESKKNQKKKTSKKKGRWIRTFWICYSSLIVVIMFIFFSISMGWMGFMPSFADLENPKTDLATEVYSEDGEMLGKYYRENRSNCKYEELPESLINALVATEDARFNQHSGVDIRALMRVVGGIVTFNRKGGGSTITQQLAKNLFPRDPDAGKMKIAFTKLKEWVVAAKLEREYSKHEILAMYLNTVDFGSNSLGIKSAAKTYFDKEPRDLTAEESAVLVGMLKAPTQYNPRRNPKSGLNRRNTVLAQMEKYGYLTKNETDSIKQIPIDMSHFSMQDHTVGKATYFREYLRLFLTEWCRNNPKADGTYYNIYTDGLKIYTTIDSRMQKHAEDAVFEHVCEYLQPMFFQHWAGRKNAPFAQLSEQETQNILNTAMKRTDRYMILKDMGWSEKDIAAEFNKKINMKIFTWNGTRDTIMSPMDSIRYMKSFLHCGLMAMDVNSGHVKAYVGGTNYKQFQFDHVKLSKRQVGSTFKPYVYAVAMLNGEYDPCTPVPNVPVTFQMPEGGTWTPKNSSNYKDGQMVTLKEALANSINNISAYLMKQYGPHAVVQLVKSMGMTSEIPEYPSICLGACELTLYEQIGAINCFPNQGVYIEPTFITKICDKNGNVIYTFTPKTNEALDQITAFKVVRLMQGVVDQGTGWSLRGNKYQLSFPLGGKTGTTDNQSDGWFVGYTPMLSCGVWVGCEDRAAHFRSIALGQGARTALPVFALFMKKCYNDPELPYAKVIKNPGKYQGKDFPIPQSYTGDPTGCNETVKQKETPNFD